MTTITLQGAEFFAYHGFYPEEQILGNKFIVDVEISFIAPGDNTDDNIDNTVDYEKVYHIMKNEMVEPRKLIETVAQTIATRIKETYPFIESLKVSLKKLNPPLNGKVESSGIQIVI